MEIKNTKKNTRKFYCEKCVFGCSRPAEWSRHIMTPKHTGNKNGNNWKSKEIKKHQNEDLLCICGRQYITNSGLWKHKKKCSFKEDFNIENMKNKEYDYKTENENKNINITNQVSTQVSNDIVIELIKQNQEFQKLIIEQNKQIIKLSKNASITNNNNNCHNKTKFNLNFFLNEQCKDALNIMDFVNNLQLQLTDLENIGKLGYSEGISKIFINGLKQLDVFKRPIHCSDLKREILYVKDQDAWEKENEENKKIKTAINHISHKNITQIPSWIEKNPNCNNSNSNKNDEYLEIVNQSMGAINQININKIIHNIAKEVVIGKE
jgi:hypothetical protein